MQFIRHWTTADRLYINKLVLKARMTEKYYLDTCIWRDFYENRFSKLGKPLGEYAAELFTKILKKRNQIIFSESLLWELKKDYSEDEIKDILNLLILNGILIKIEITQEEHTEAKRLAQNRNLPYVDCLNAVQARNNKAVMVSRDAHFTGKLADVIKTLKPEQIS